MDRIRRKRLLTKKRKLRVRRRLHGTAQRPRLTVFRSLTNIYCQLIDDDEGRTLYSSSTVALRKAGTQLKSGGNKDAATAIGKDIAEKAKAAGVTQVVFDRFDERRTEQPDLNGTKILLHVNFRGHVGLF